MRLALVLLSTALALACSKRAGEAEAHGRQGALGAYRAQLAPLAVVEKEALAAVTSHTGGRYTDDATLLEALRATALPRYREYVAGLEKVTAPDDGTKAFHEKLLALARRELAVLERLERAIDRGDGTAVLWANQEHRALHRERGALLAEFPAAAGARIEASAGTTRR